MIWLVGEKGMLGSAVRRGLEEKGVRWLGTDSEVDITDADALHKFSSGKKIEWIVNCAAYTAVDRAEDEAQAARSLNAFGPKNLAIMARNAGAGMIHISTDYVFDGTGSRPYREDDVVQPLGIYGRTKAEGEKLVQEYCPESYILRSSWLYGKEGTNFVRTMLKLMAENERIRVVADQWGTPTYAPDLSNAILTIIASGCSEYGIYNYSNDGQTSWHGFAMGIHEVARALGVLSRDCIVEPINSSQYPTRARRPAYSVLSKEKIKRVFSLVIPDWRESLRIFLKDSSIKPDN